MKKSIFSASVISFVFAANAALSATCPIGNVGQTRTISLTPVAPATASCYAYGDGNVGNGSNDPIPVGMTNGANTLSFASGVTPLSGLTEIADSSDGASSLLSGNTGSGNSGTVTISNTGTSIYDTFVLAFKFGKPQQNTPDWAAFLISGDGVYDFAQSINQGELSHTVLYGTTVAAVPVPAGALLMLTGVGGLALTRRRKST